MSELTARPQRTRRRALMTIIACGMALASVFVAAPASAAAPPGYGGPVATCSGEVYATIEMSGPAYVLIWYSTKNGGTYCAKTFDNLAGSHYMTISIRREDWKTVWTDAGTFTTYAGGVEVYGVASRCAWVVGRVNVNGVVSTGQGWVC